MNFCNHYLCNFFLILNLWEIAFSLNGAPGTLTLKVETPHYVEDCMEKDCKYVLQTCIGSGRSEIERCLWLPTKQYSNELVKTPKYLAEMSFEVDNVRSSFYFNANLSYYQNGKLLKVERFKDTLFQYSSNSAQVHSLDFTTLTIDVIIKCKPGFYPKTHCSVSCFEKPSIYICDQNGRKICKSGYVFDSVNNQCNIDNCLSESNYCQNNGTCISETRGPKCHCTTEYFGKNCEKWNPCQNNPCQNGGKCGKNNVTQTALCLCKSGYYGSKCENKEKTCILIKCESYQICKIINKETQCINNTLTSIPRTSTSKKVTSKIKSVTFTTTEKILLTYIENETNERKDGVKKRLQYHPFINEYTTVSIVVVLVVFMIGCFGVTFWVLKIKYFQKKTKTYSNFSTLPVMPSIFNSSTYRSGEENFRRWHSLDDNSFYFCNQTHVEPYHTYRSGSNVYPKHDQVMETCRDTYGSLNSQHRMCHSMIRSRMPVLCEPSTINSSDLNFNAASDSQNNSEKVDDFNNNYLVIDNPPANDL